MVIPVLLEEPSTDYPDFQFRIMPDLIYKKKPWRKIMYERQDYPDTYCGDDFLIGLRHNVTAEKYSFGTAVLGSLILMQQLSSVVLYVCLFSFIFLNYLSYWALLVACALAACLGYAVHLAVQSAVSCKNVLMNLQTLCIYVSFGWAMSPIVQTLTQTISTDTIYAMSTGMFIANIVFHDYGVDVAIVSPAISLNAGFFGVVCLVSRLDSYVQVFVMLMLAVEIFVLWPLLRREIQDQCGRVGSVFISVGLSVSVGYFLSVLSPVMLGLYVFFHIFVTLVCPLWLIRIQHWKSTIHGPWDEAVIPD